VGNVHPRTRAGVGAIAAKLTIETGRDAYRHYCDDVSEIPLFAQPWWLDAVAGADGWDAVLALRGDRVAGVLPYAVRRQFGFVRLGLPPLTRSLGPWLPASEAKYAKRLAHEKDVMQALAGALPAFAEYRQRWHPEVVNWLPLYWLGYRQTTRYTYILEPLADHDALWEGMQPKIRSDVRKARDRHGLEVIRDPSATLDAFLALHQRAVEVRDEAAAVGSETIRRLDQACAERGCRTMLLARDAEGREHAGAYVVWHEGTAYYLIGCADPDLRNSGAGSLVVWTAIKTAAQHVQRFDFEGSMIEPIERFFRGFGGRQQPYFEVWKTRSRVLRVLRALREPG